MTVKDDGIRRTSSFCNGLWNTMQARRLHHLILRRIPMEIALYARVSTLRQQQHQSIDQQRSRLHDDVATQPD